MAEGLVLGIAAAIVVALGYGLLRRTRAVDVNAWARARSLALTDRSRELVDAHLRRGLRWRLGGAVAGIFFSLGMTIPGLEMLIGYLAGGIVAELTEARLSSSRRTATLSPRSVSAYVPREAIRFFRILSASVAVASGVLFLLLPAAAESAPSDGRGLLVVPVGVLLVILSVEVTLRYVAGRSQRGDPSDLVAADDALRSSSMHATLGAGIAISFLLLSAALSHIGAASSVTVVRWFALAGAVACVGAAVTSWLRYGHDTPWVVRRGGTPEGAML